MLVTEARKFIENKFGYCYSNDSYYNYINVWLDWYKGYVKSFHTIRMSNGITTPKRTLYRLCMAKRVCEDWTSSIMGDGYTIVVNSSNRKSSIFVQGTKGNGGVLGSNNFDVLFTTALERMFALGTSALVLSLDGVSVDEYGYITDSSNARIKIKSIEANNILPITYDNNSIQDVSFLSDLTVNGKTYHIVSSHILEEDGYVIYNDILDDGYKNSDLNLGILPVVRTLSKKPLFSIMTTGIANNIDLSSPLGVSIYSDAIDNLKGCDVVFDSCIREVETGQRIVMMHKNLLTTDEEGNPIAPQDVKQTYMQFFGDDAVADINEFIKEFHPNLNTDNLDKELQNQLNMLSNKVGLGTDYYKFDSSSGVVTATQYVGDRNDMLRNSKRVSNAIKVSIKTIVDGILFLGKNVMGYAVDDNAKIDIVSTDGVLIDDISSREQDRKDVELGLMSKAEYRAKWYGETIEEAEAKIKSMNSDILNNNDVAE